MGTYVKWVSFTLRMSYDDLYDEYIITIENDCDTYTLFNKSIKVLHLWTDAFIETTYNNMIVSNVDSCCATKSISFAFIYLFIGFGTLADAMPNFIMALEHIMKSDIW